MGHYDQGYAFGYSQAKKNEQKIPYVCSSMIMPCLLFLFFSDNFMIFHKVLWVAYWMCVEGEGCF